MIRPVRPDKLALLLRVLARWGASPAAGIAGAAINHPDEAMVEDEAGLADLRRGPPPLQRARPGPCRRGRGGGRRGRDHVPQPPRLRRGDARDLEAGRQRPVHEHGLRRAAAGRRGRARGARGADLRRASSRRLLEQASRGGQGDRAAALRRLDRRRRRGGADRDARRADRGERRQRPRSPRRVEPVRDPDLGHDGDAEGRAARPARHARPARRAVLEDPAAGATSER